VRLRCVKIAKQWFEFAPHGAGTGPAAKLDKKRKRESLLSVSLTDLVHIKRVQLKRRTLRRALPGRFVALACKMLNGFVTMNSHHSLIGDFTGVGAILPGKSKSRSSRQPNRHASRKPTRAKHKRRPARGTLAETRNLVLAALRVWELKQRARG